MWTITRPIVMRALIAVISVLLCASRVAAQTETVEYYGLDALGSVRVVFDASGNVTGRMDYGPFGESLVTGSGMPSRAYAGLFRDGEAGLDHAEARSYQSRTGRFTTVDPAYAGLFTPQDWNRYAYVGNNPLGNVDPSGTCPDGWICFNWLDIVMGKLFGNTTGGGASGGSGGGGESATHDQTRSGSGGGGGGQPPTQPEKPPAQPPPPPPPPPTPPAPPKPPAPPPGPKNGPERNTWKPHFCGGGAFGYAGREFDYRKVKGEAVALVSFDSKEGGSHGGLIGLDVAGHTLVGLEASRTWHDWREHDSLIGLQAATKKFGPIDPSKMDFGGLAQVDPSGTISLGFYLGAGLGGGGLYFSVGFSCN